MKTSQIAARALSCVGVQFRPQGRTRKDGLDCIGLAAFACGISAERVPSRYAQRSGRRERIEQGLAQLGLCRLAPGDAQAGDILIFEPGVGQLHLAVRTHAGIVHADAGLRKVVERPLPLPWPVLSAWRFPETA